MSYKGYYIVGFFKPLKNTYQQKNIILMNVIAIQYRNLLWKKQTQKLVVLVVSVTIVWWLLMCICMRITILCLKVAWKQAWQQLLCTEQIEYY